MKYLILFFSILLVGCTTKEPEPAAKPLVGVYYYPWFIHPQSDAEGMVQKLRLDRERTRNFWEQHVMRSLLVPQQKPELGFYNSFKPEVIGGHIKQSERGNIDFWAMSWWGPDSKTDIIIRECVLKHPDMKKLKYAILYESTGRIKSRTRGTPFRNLNYKNVIPDFKYIRETFFNDPNYLKVDGKGVVFVYLGREYFRNQGHDVLAQLRKEVPDVYFVSDDVYEDGYQAEWAEPFDAVTAYDVYGQSVKVHGGTRKAIDVLATNYKDAREKANSVGTAFIPAIAPGYNDRAVRDGNIGRARYFTDDPNSKEGDIFRAMIDDVALKNLDSKADNMIIVTSFNEWFEDSQIEPTAGDQGTTTVDGSENGDYFTGGQKYVDYGYLYLDILSEHTK